MRRDPAETNKLVPTRDPKKPLLHLLNQRMEAIKLFNSFQSASRVTVYTKLPESKTPKYKTKMDSVNCLEQNEPFSLEAQIHPLETTLSSGSKSNLVT